MTGATAPSFSIVIPTYQRRDLVCDVVRAVQAIVFAGSIEAIVVVDGSTDGTAGALREIDTSGSLQVIEQPNLGAAAARNRGAAVASGEILLFLDDDMICEPDILDAHARRYAEGADAVLGDIPLDPASPASSLARAVGKWAAERRAQLVAGRPLRHDDMLTGQLSVRRSVFEELGGFDACFTAGGSFGNEDIDFGLRLLNRHRIVFAPDAVSRQRYVVTPRAYLRQWRDAGAADVVLMAKHPDHSMDIGGSAPASAATRALAAVPGFASAVGAAAIAIAGTFVSDGMAGRASGRLIGFARNLAYWHGHRAAKRPCAVLVLCYHAILDLADDPLLAEYGCPRIQFEAQLDHLLGRGFTFVDADHLLALIDGTTRSPRKAVLLTLDDCYAELPEIAREVLKPRGIPALAFAVASLIGKSNEWDQPAGAGTIALADGAGLMQMIEDGMEIGCHSGSHADLCGLAPDELSRETEGAAEYIIALGLPRPRFFAYPYGESNAACRAAVAAAGYRAAFGLGQRRAEATSERFCIPRVEILARDRGWRFRMQATRPGLLRPLPGRAIANRARRWIERRVKRAAKRLVR